MLNKIGPRTDPCGTPCNNCDHELKVVYTDLSSLPTITKVTQNDLQRVFI